MKEMSEMYGELCEPEIVEKALEGITDVVLLAGLVGDPITKKYSEFSEKINAVGIRSCIDQLNNHNLDRLVFVSTCSNYGLIENDNLADENFELRPQSLYAKAKVAAEEHILSLKGSVDYTPTILRFATAFGLSPRMRFDLSISEFTKELALERELLVFDAHTWRPYCHVRDFARLIELVLNSPQDKVGFEVFNAGGDANNATKQNIVDEILRHLPNGKIVYQDQGADPRNYRVDFRKVRETLGFEPKYTITDGIEELLSALRGHVFDDVDKNISMYGKYEINDYQ